ncbi:MAG: PfkB family carbohydrate kinase [bacterium]
MSVLVVGSVALDTVKTPFGEAGEVLGGAAVYFSMAASLFTNVNLVGVVGTDFPKEHVELLSRRSIDLTGLQKREGQTFRWSGEYTYNLNEAKTLDTKLNVFEDFRPDIPEVYRNSESVFLANIDPELQLQVLEQVRSPRVVACDTMNFWISGKRGALLKLLKRIDIIILNDAEIRQLTNEPNLVKAANILRSFGPRYVIIKKGEHGVLMFTGSSFFSAPAYPLEYIFDPTGAGDTFAGGFMGYLDTCEGLAEANLRKAIVYGSVLASFNVEEFSLRRLSRVHIGEVKDRFREFERMSRFEGV